MGQLWGAWAALGSCGLLASTAQSTKDRTPPVTDPLRAPLPGGRASASDLARQRRRQYALDPGLK